MSLAGAASVQLSVLLHHDDLALLLHLVRVLLHVVEDAPVVLLGDADQLRAGARTGEPAAWTKRAARSVSHIVTHAAWEQNQADDFLVHSMREKKTQLPISTKSNVADFLKV